ncbi:hypothetical protein PMKS-003243 [Pichia membranifaciens]|uniref:RNA-splicing protein MRS2 n=1 Tax=Pichia membranifaciens TaxID=4926 RepID=A0A1Q2YJU7_9ASCO|nr:hypothetical protein PMKS-003243 [Pichia membranifaciens]
MAVLETELSNHLGKVDRILNELDSQIDRANLKDLLVNSKGLTMFYQKSLLIKNTLDELLDNDEDLENMYLTENYEIKKLICDNEAAGAPSSTSSSSQKDLPSQSPSQSPQSSENTHRVPAPAPGRPPDDDGQLKAVEQVRRADQEELHREDPAAPEPQIIRQAAQTRQGHCLEVAYRRAQVSRAKSRPYLSHVPSVDTTPLLYRASHSTQEQPERTSKEKNGKSNNIPPGEKPCCMLFPSPPPQQ